MSFGSLFFVGSSTIGRQASSGDNESPCGAQKPGALRRYVQLAVARQTCKKKIRLADVFSINTQPTPLSYPIEVSTRQWGANLQTMEWKGRPGVFPSGFLGMREVGLKESEAQNCATHEVHPFFQIFCFFITNYDPETFLDEIIRNQCSGFTR